MYDGPPTYTQTIGAAPAHPPPALPSSAPFRANSRRNVRLHHLLRCPLSSQPKSDPTQSVCSRALPPYCPSYCTAPTGVALHRGGSAHSHAALACALCERAAASWLTHESPLCQKRPPTPPRSFLGHFSHQRRSRPANTPRRRCLRRRCSRAPCQVRACPPSSPDSGW